MMLDPPRAKTGNLAMRRIFLAGGKTHEIKIILTA